MIQKIKNLLKKILPPPLQIFYREIARIMDAIARIQQKIGANQSQLIAEQTFLKKQQEKVLTELATVRNEHRELLCELAAFRKQQELLLESLTNLQKDNQAIMQELSEIQAQQAQNSSTIRQEISDNLYSLSQNHTEIKQMVGTNTKALSGEVRRQGHRVLQKIERIQRKNQNLPLISVLIPVYNVSPYLRDCLDSVLRQTMQDIEIICVNDGSTDTSGQILDEYASRDARIRVIHKEENQGLLLARKTAVETACGEYILFVDSDDIIDPELCAFAEQITKNEYADIIQFGAEVCDYTENTKKVTWLRRALMPVDRELESGEVLKEAYVTRSYVTSLWGKLYKTELCKKAYADLPNSHCYIGEDIFTFFYLAHYAQSYKGIPTRAYYTYRHGLGITQTDNMPLDRFELYCKMAQFDRHIYDHLILGSEDQEIIDAYCGMVRRLATDCCNIYAYRMAEENKQEALNMLILYWSDSDIANEAATEILGFPLRDAASGDTPSMS